MAEEAKQDEGGARAASPKTGVKYERLSVSERKNIVDGRILDRERQHYTTRLDVIASTTDGQTESLLQQANRIEQELEDLKQERAALDTA